MKSNKFEIFDRFFGAHWFLTGYSCRYFSELLQEGGDRSIKQFIGLMQKDVNSMIFDVEQFNAAGNYYADKLINDIQWRKRMYDRHHADLKRYFVISESFRKLPFNTMTNRQIITAADPLIKLQERVRVLGVMLNGLVLDGRNHLSNKLRNEVAKFFGHGQDFETHWALLTQPTRLSIRQKKELAISKLAEKVYTYPSNKIEIKLRKLYDQYCWLDYMYYGPAATLESFKAELKDTQRNDKILHLPVEIQMLREKQRELMSRHSFTPRAKNLVRLAQHVLWQKGWRKDAEYHGFYCYEPMFREIAKRNGETDWRNLLYMFPWEFKSFVLSRKPSLGELKQRRAFSILVVRGPTDVKIFTGPKAKSLYKRFKLSQDFSKLKEARGQCAFPGKAKGTVRIVQTPADMKKMRQGDILLSQATSPDLLPAMKKAGAIVTNTGGLICHAAITARELKLPCIVGTVSATLVFKDGDLVEVDANKGIVKKI